MKYESLYANLINKYRLYDNNRKYLSRIIVLEEVENNSKFSSSLISETDYIKKEIDILNNKNKLLESKYDLLKVYNNYYYSVLLY